MRFDYVIKSVCNRARYSVFSRFVNLALDVLSTYDVDVTDVIIQRYWLTVYTISMHALADKINHAFE